jgi:BioD-like phosphotransacetylase family protein
MSGLHVTSPGPGEGKTAVACALLRSFGLRTYERDGGDDHPDGQFVARLLDASAEAKADARTAREGRPHPAPLPEGGGTWGQTQRRAGPPVSEGEAARADRASLAVVAYRGDATAGAMAELARRHRPIGVILNAVPAAQQRVVEREVRPALEELGVPVLGVLPEERALRAASVGELAAFLGGEVMTAEDALDNLVENYMVGAMSHLSGRPYFNRKQNKAVVTGGDRLDVIMAALGTPCRCVVVTGGFDPDPVLLERAEAEEVPIVKVSESATATLDRIGLFLRGVRFRHEAKIEPFVRLFRERVDLSALERALGASAAAVRA